MFFFIKYICFKKEKSLFMYLNRAVLKKKRAAASFGFVEPTVQILNFENVVPQEVTIEGKSD